MADHRLPLPHMSASTSSAKRMTRRPLVCASPPEGEHETWPHLHHLQLLQALLHQLLYLPLVLDRLVLAERVPCSPLRVFSEIVRCELLALSEELAILSRKVVNISVFLGYEGGAPCLAPAATPDPCCSLDREGLTSDRTCWGESPLSADDSDMAKEG